MKRIIRVLDTDIRIEGSGIRIAQLEGDGFHFLADPEPIIAALRTSKERIDLFSFTQKVPDTTPKFRYPMQWENAAALPISTFDHWWDKQINFKARNKAKQAEKKGVVLRELPFDDKLVNGIWQIYNECPVRQGRRFVHYGKTIEVVRKEADTFIADSIFIGAYFADELIGFVKLTMDQERTLASTMNIISMIRHRDKAPTNALIAHSVRACASRGLKYLVYARFAYGKKAPDSVADFKERNGFQRIDFPRYFVPLTSIGEIAFRLGLHRKVVDRIPAPVAAKLRDIRSAWKNRKLRAVAEGPF